MHQHIHALEGRAAFVPSADRGQRIDHLLVEALELTAGKRSWRRIWDWWYGSPIEAAWACLHEAELRVIRYASDDYILGEGLENARVHAMTLDLGDADRQRLISYINESGKTNPGVT